jgi:hypothetical protein
VLPAVLADLVKEFADQALFLHGYEASVQMPWLGTPQANCTLQHQAVALIHQHLIHQHLHELDVRKGAC